MTGVEEIQQAIRRARVAVLLVSPDFIASDFIAENELPPLLAAAKKDGALIIPVIVDHSRFRREPELYRFQALNDPSRPLAALSPHEQSRVLDEVAERIEIALEEGLASRSPQVNEADPKVRSTERVSPATSATQDLVALYVPGEQLLVFPLLKVEVGEQVTLHLVPKSSADAAVLRSLGTPRRDVLGIAFGDTVVEAVLRDVAQRREGGTDLWVLRLDKQDTRGSFISESSFNNYSADQLAEMRVRRILLDEKLPPWVANDHFLDMFVSGSGTGSSRLVVKGSPLPILFEQTPRERFVTTARLVSLLWLHLSGAIAVVERLDLTLQGTELSVDFRGRRPQVYQNQEPMVIEVRGMFELT